jgi:hypothetical protein
MVSMAPVAPTPMPLSWKKHPEPPNTTTSRTSQAGC